MRQLGILPCFDLVCFFKSIFQNLFFKNRSPHFSKSVCKNDFEIVFKENDFEIIFKKNDFEIVLQKNDFEIIFKKNDFEIVLLKNDFEIDFEI